MKSCTYRVSLTLTALVVLSPTIAAAAQQPATNLVPLRFTYMSAGDIVTIPIDPPVAPTRIAIAGGQSDLLGSFTGIAHSITHLGPDGNTAYVDGGVGVLTAANGDTISFTYVGVPRPITAPTVRALEDHVIITGGNGRFVGARGSGVLNLVIDFSKPFATATFEGMITAPKP